MMLRWCAQMLGDRYPATVRMFASARYPDDPRPIARLTTADVRELFADAVKEMRT